MEIYVIENGEQAGPYSRFKIREKIMRGEIDEKSLAWYRGLDEWKPVSEITELQSVLLKDEDEAEPYAPPGEQEVSSPAAMASAKDESGHRPMVQAWIRFWARYLDFTYFSSIIGIVGVATGQMDTGYLLEPSLFYVLLLLVAWIFVETALLSTIGTTPGRAILNVGLAREDGSRLTTVVALKRSVLVWFRGIGFGFIYFSLVTLAISFLELTRSGTTWWDNIAGTRVTHGRVTFARAFIALGIAMLLSWIIVAIGGLPPEFMEGAKPESGEGG